MNGTLFKIRFSTFEDTGVIIICDFELFHQDFLCIDQ